MNDSPHGFSVRTSCRTVEEFIDEFHALTTKDTIFVPIIDARLAGRECGFVILLANGQPVLAGTCVVVDLFVDKTNPYRRAGMRVAIKRLGQDSQQTFAALEAARELEDEPDTLVKMTRVPLGTHELPPLELGDGSVVIRTARAPSPQLPMNPLMDVDDDSLDCVLH